MKDNNISFSAYEILGIGIPNPTSIVKFIIPECWTTEQRNIFINYLDAIDFATSSIEVKEMLDEKIESIIIDFTKQFQNSN